MIRRALMIAGLGFLCLAASCASRPESSARAWVNPKDGMRFAWVPAGSFTAEVPVDSNDANDAGKTSLRTITFEQGYWVGRTEVTLGQFRRFIRETGYVTDAEKAGNRWTWKNPGFPQRDDHPVVYVSFADALAYARWAGVDLPTEVQWLYASRAGTTTRFYWGDTFDDRYVWHRLNTDGTGTRPVARKLPNAWGLYDMVGNAREYCLLVQAGFKPAPANVFATRGGSWTRCPSYRGRTGGLFEGLFDAEVAPRLEKYEPNPQYPPYPWDDDRGFRCIRRADP
ncbi:MAG: formylglycine-generating enzyme family protein [Solirubrobacterales bacterium]